MKPFTEIIQAIELSSMRRRSIQWKSNWRILSKSRIAFALPWPVLSATPNALSMAVSFKCGELLLSSRKFTQPITRSCAWLALPALSITRIPHPVQSRLPSRLRRYFQPRNVAFGMKPLEDFQAPSLILPAAVFLLGVGRLELERRRLIPASFDFGGNERQKHLVIVAQHWRGGDG